MMDQDFHMLPPSLVQDIEDAILLGHVTELDDVIKQIHEGDAPMELRAKLEALRYFRAHYGKGGIAPPKEEMEKKKVALMEAAWGAELLDMVRNNETPFAKQA